MHLVLKSSKATGKRSLFTQTRWIEKLIKAFALRDGVKIFEFSNNGNYIHLLVQAKDAKLFRFFLMSISARIAQRMTGSRKGAPQEGKFWDFIPYTRIVEWGRDFRNALEYVVLNIMESKGLVVRKKVKATTS